MRFQNLHSPSEGTPVILPVIRLIDPDNISLAFGDLAKPLTLDRS